jgi:hypothetical protein
MEIPQRGGLPHSDIHGSKPARGSPWLFAACHVLHRLLVPRHPPNALLTLKITNDTSPNTMIERNVAELLLSTQQSSLNTIAVRWSHLPITEDRHPVRQTQTAAPRDAPKPDSHCQKITPRLLLREDTNGTNQPQPASPDTCPSPVIPVPSPTIAGGDDRDRTDDPLLAKQVLSQLSYVPNRGTSSSLEPKGINLVGQGGLEPPTPRLSSVCSNQLSY